jgi:hypothetical protein
LRLLRWLLLLLLLAQALQFLQELLGSLNLLLLLLLAVLRWCRLLRRRVLGRLLHILNWLGSLRHGLLGCDSFVVIVVWIVGGIGSRLNWLILRHGAARRRAPVRAQHDGFHPAWIVNRSHENEVVARSTQQ